MKIDIALAGLPRFFITDFIYLTHYNTYSLYLTLNLSITLFNCYLINVLNWNDYHLCNQHSINETKRNSNKDNKKFYTFQEKEIKICIKQ